MNIPTAIKFYADHTLSLIEVIPAIQRKISKEIGWSLLGHFSLIFEHSFI